MGVRIDGSNDVVSAADGSLTVDGLSLSVTGIITASGGFKVGSAYTAYSNGNVETTGIITTSGGIDVSGGSTFTGGIDVSGSSTFSSNVGIAQSIFHVGDTNTSFGFPDADTFTLVTGGSEALRVDDGQKVLINQTTQSVSHPLQVTAASDAHAIAINGRSADDIGELTFFENDQTTRLGELQYRQDHLNLRHRVGYIAFAPGGTTERIRMDSSGRLLINATSNVGSSSVLQVREDGFGRNIEVFRSYDSANTPARIRFSNSRGTGSSPTIVVNGDDLGEIRFNGHDGTNYDTPAAAIFGVVDGTPGENDMPGRLEFHTTADGGSSTTERVRIDSGGRLLVGKQSHSGDALFVVETEHASGGIIGEFDNNDSGNFGGMRVLGGVTDRECRLQSLYGNSFFTFYTEATGAATERVRITKDGSVLVGQTNESFGNVGHILNASGQHYVIASGNTPLLINRQSNDGELVRLAKDGSTVGNITNSGADVSYNPFMGSHWGRLEDSSKPEILPGTILETVNKAVEWKVIEFTVDGVQKRQAYNGSAENGDSVTVEYEGVSYTGTVADEVPNSDALNKHVCVKVSDTAASKAVFGVFFGWDESETEGIIGAWNDMLCAAVGNYYIRIKSGQSLEIGDLIESDGSGCGVVQSDDIIRSKTVAKVTSTTPQKVYTDGSFLVTCVLYSG